MTAPETLVDQLKRDEGCVLHSYRCPAGYVTIGYGRNLDAKGITAAEALTMLDNDIHECRVDLRKTYSWFMSLDEVRRDALTNMRFQLGSAGLAKFRKMLAAFADGDYERAADEAMDSKWAKTDTPARAARLELQIRTGIRQ